RPPQPRQADAPALRATPRHGRHQIASPAGFSTAGRPSYHRRPTARFSSFSHSQSRQMPHVLYDAQRRAQTLWYGHYTSYSAATSLDRCLQGKSNWYNGVTKFAGAARASSVVLWNALLTAPKEQIE